MPDQTSRVRRRPSTPGKVSAVAARRGSLGAQGRVWRVNAATGRVRLLADGLVSATGLAVNGRGDVLASELFAGRVSRIRAGSSTPKSWTRTPLPGAVEWGPDGSVYKTSDVLTGRSGEDGDAPKGALLVYRR